MPSRPLARIGAVSAFAGAAMLFVATLLHPSDADPNDALAAFTEYAADPHWTVSHLGQFFGVLLLGVALVATAEILDGGPRGAAARIGRAGAAASVAVAAALQAVDGIALGRMVQRWAHASGDARLMAFEAAFAVRQVEIGCASFLGLVMGLTVVAIAVAMLGSERFPSWLGAVGIAGGLGSVGGGFAQAFTGFSDLSMTVAMPSAMLLLLWALAVGVVLWRVPAADPASGALPASEAGRRAS